MSEMKISWIETEGNGNEFESTKEFDALGGMEKFIALSMMLQDLDKVRAHVLVACFFKIFSPRRDRGHWQLKLSAFHEFINNLGLSMPSDFEALAMEHLRDGFFSDGLAPCLICDRWCSRNNK